MSTEQDLPVHSLPNFIHQLWIAEGKWEGLRQNIGCQGLARLHFSLLFAEDAAIKHTLLLLYVVHVIERVAHRPAVAHILQIRRLLLLHVSHDLVGQVVHCESLLRRNHLEWLPLRLTHTLPLRRDHLVNLIV